MEKGNGGGPVLNDHGEMVGLATFGYEGRANFAESVDLARDFLKDQSVTPRESTFTTKYDRAVSEFERPDHGMLHGCSANWKRITPTAAGRRISWSNCRTGPCLRLIRPRRRRYSRNIPEMREQ